MMRQERISRKEWRRGRGKERRWRAGLGNQPLYQTYRYDSCTDESSSYHQKEADGTDADTDDL